MVSLLDMYVISKVESRWTAIMQEEMGQTDLCLQFY